MMPVPQTHSAALPQNLAEVLQLELACFKPLAIYLFGSAAKPALRSDSDLDLAFLSPQACDVVAVFDASQRLARILSREVDLVDLGSASTVLRKEVVTKGRLLLETDRYRRQEFEMYALSDYARLNEERAPVLRALGVELQP
jgi:predicted nucleotidyltransferase